jgi:hypothetical protein
MRAEQVIVTHGNTDFDAFARMLAARRLFPARSSASPASLNRNVREFARLHADELGARRGVAARARRDPALIVVETCTSASRSASSSRSRSTRRREGRLRPPRGELPDWAQRRTSCSRRTAR